MRRVRSQNARIGYSTYFSLFLCGIDTSLFPRKTLSCLRGVPLLFLSCEGAQRLQSVKDRRPGAVGGKGRFRPGASIGIRNVYSRVTASFAFPPEAREVEYLLKFIC